MTGFKICGLREAGHAVAAADAGADYLGFVFVPGVRRQLSGEQAEAVIQEYRRLRGSGGPKLVGLFANQPAGDVNAVVSQCRLDFVQLCGEEGPAYWERIDAPVIKQIRIHDDGQLDELVSDTMRRVEEVTSRGYVALLDKEEPGFLGGTGRSFDWRIAAEVARCHDFLLAGGLSPDHVASAITTVNPWGVDVSSGVESDGVKDPAKIAAFAREVRRASSRLNESSSA